MTVFLCAFGIAHSVYAAQTSEELLKQQQEVHAQTEKLEREKKAAEQERSAAQSSLSQARDSIREITGEREMVGEAISDLNDDLVSLLATIAMIEEQIADTEVQIADTQAAYEEAKAHEEEQYAAMKARAKFMYEKGDQDMIVLLLQSESISDFLNRATYVQELHDYDRRELDAFIQTKNEAEALGEQLEEAKSELEADHFELEQSQSDMETILSELQEEAENYDVMLAHAKQDAAAYQLKIKQQASAIDQLATQIKAKAAEEEKLKQEAAEAKQREDDEKARAEAEAAALAAGLDPSTISDGTSSSESSSSESSGSSGSSGRSYASPGSATGANIASYACQFVGNPYVAGGTSLTNGCDCSGFTMAVYQAFGISIPRTSWSQQRVGSEVSLDNARAGDIVCYAGHVAIYLGNGRIVHASTERTGIKYGDVNYKTIITIRRVV
ncbi:MAG: C40 family peptidase [Lachnospiraceae bacterium]|nr:C40 family peptidase [Lachnospiraceae bacterium]